MNIYYLYYNFFVFLNILILSSILFLRRKNPKTNIILGLIILCPGLNFLNNIIIISNYIYQFPLSLFLFQGTAASYGFLIYWYTKSMLGQKISWKNPLHYYTLAGVLIDIWFYIEFKMMTPSEQYNYLTCLFNKACYPWQMNLINAIFVMSWMGYFIDAYIITLKHEKSAKGFFSDTDKINISYLKNFLRLVITLNFILMVMYLSLQTHHVEYIIIPSIVLMVNVFFLYYAFHKNTVFNTIEYCNLISNSQSLEKFRRFEEPLCQEIKELKQENKSKKYTLTQLEIEENYQKIIRYIEKEKPYLDPNINLTKFSFALNACSHNISLTINIKFDKNFFDFINYYRVEEAKRILESFDKNKYNLNMIYQDCGFNSKSSFYRAFKKFTRSTPSEYIENKLKEYCI